MTKQEFAAGFREWTGRARIESKYEVTDIHASGDVGYVWSYISIVMTSKETGGGTKREGRGYGQRSHEAMVEWLWSQGLSRLWLTTEPGTRAQHFYESAGWHRIGEANCREAQYELLRPNRSST